MHLLHSSSPWWHQWTNYFAMLPPWAAPRERESLGEGDAILCFGTLFGFNKSQQVPGVQIAPKETWCLDWCMYKLCGERRFIVSHSGIYWLNSIHTVVSLIRGLFWCTVAHPPCHFPMNWGSFFKTVDRIRCDKELLDKAQGFADAGNISEEQALK